MMETKWMQHMLTVRIELDTELKFRVVSCSFIIADVFLLLLL